jgi:hypothetical protein
VDHLERCQKLDPTATNLAAALSLSAGGVGTSWHGYNRSAPHSVHFAHKSNFLSQLKFYFGVPILTA